MDVLTKLSYFCLLSVYISGISYSLENGVARTPPMGWLSWERFKCNLKCDSDPKNCISEKLFMAMADILIKDGYHDAGYEFVNIDDCWMAPSRTNKGNLFSDPVRFPHGIKYLADYMHSRGLKLGIYQNFGFRTCMGFPGLIGHMAEDSDAFAKWEVDMVKIDGCFTPTNYLDNGYIEMGNWLNKTNRPMLYSCSWPYYQLLTQMEPDYKTISAHCNMWRNFHDIQDSWDSIEQIIEFFGDNQEILLANTGPGRWSDPDMLMIGNSGLNPGQSRAQMAIWCIIPAPLLMSNDLRDISLASKDILLNSKAIAINQDPLGLPGKRIFQKDLLEVWRRPISPLHKTHTSFALVFLNRHHSRKIVEVNFEELGLRNEKGYFVSRIFDKKYHGAVYPNKTFNILVSGMDVVMLNCKLIF